MAGSFPLSLPEAEGVPLRLVHSSRLLVAGVWALHPAANRRRHAALPDGIPCVEATSAVVAAAVGARLGAGRRGRAAGHGALLVRATPVHGTASTPRAAGYRYTAAAARRASRGAIRRR